MTDELRALLLTSSQPARAPFPGMNAARSLHPCDVIFSRHRVLASCPGDLARGGRGARLIRDDEGRCFLVGDGRVISSPRPQTIRRWASLVRQAAVRERKLSRTT